MKPHFATYKGMYFNHDEYEKEAARADVLGMKLNLDKIPTHELKVTFNLLDVLRWEETLTGGVINVQFVDGDSVCIICKHEDFTKQINNAWS